jgi:excisionase family DNA binding protein
MRSAHTQHERPRAYRVNDFCRLFGVGRTGLYKLLKEGKLPSVRIGGRRLIPADAAEALLNGGKQ